MSAGVRAIGIDRLSKAVYASDGRLVPNDKLVLAAGSLPFMPPIGGLHSDDGALLPGTFAFRTLGDFSRMTRHGRSWGWLCDLGFSGGLLGFGVGCWGYYDRFAVLKPKAV